MTQLSARIRDVFSVDLPLRTFFEAPTIAGLAPRVEAALRRGALDEAPPFTRLPRPSDAFASSAADFPLSFAQERLWFLDQLEPGSPLYNCPAAVRLKGRLDVSSLARSLQEILARHEVLRTSFPIVDGHPVQRVRPPSPFPLPLLDLTPLPPLAREAEAARLARDDAQRPFDLAHGPLLRASLLRLDHDDHVALLTLHHVVSDAWSTSVLVRELAALYPAFLHHRPSPLPDLPFQYADFAAWQRRALAGTRLDQLLHYWKRQLADLTPLALPTDRPRPRVPSLHGATAHFLLPRPLLDSLQSLSRAHGTTLFMTLLAAFKALLYRYSGQNDLAVGTAVAGRNRAETEPLIGFFVNLLVLRTHLQPDAPFSHLLAQERNVALDAFAHQDLPFEKLVQELQPERDGAAPPLVPVAFGLQNAPAEALELGGLDVALLDSAHEPARYDLTVWMLEGHKGLQTRWSWRVDLFGRDTIRSLHARLETLLTSVVGNVHCPVDDLEIWGRDGSPKYRHEDAARAAADRLKLIGTRPQPVRVRLDPSVSHGTARDVRRDH